MKGIILTLLEGFVAAKAGQAKLEEIRARSSLKTQERFLAAGSYPDEDFAALLDASAAALGETKEKLLRAFGRFSFPKLAHQFPAYVVRYPHPKQFLLAVDSIIHIEVGKRYEGASPPRLVCTDPAEDRLLIEYHSPRRLCPFMEGLIDGVADLYKTAIKQKQRRCVLKGDDACEFDLKFKK